jgi:hypothetical protein
MRTIFVATLLVALGAPAATVVTAQDKAAGILQQMRATLGGEKLTAMKALSVEGPFRRDMGGRQMEGTLVLTFELPGRFHRSEENELPGGMSLERIAVLSGDKAWDDMQQRGGMGGGGGMRMEIVTRPPGQGGDLNPQAIEEARLKRLRSEMGRWMFAFFGGANLQPTFVAVAEAPDGKADVVELKDERGMTVRLFVDQATHMPLMLQYQDVRPRVNIMDGGRGGGRGGPGRGGFDGGGGGRGGGGGAAGGGGGAEAGVPPPPPPPGGGTDAQRGGGGGRAMDPAAREEMRRRMESMPPPQPTMFTMYFTDYKKVDGVMIPHRISQSADGATVEEWEIKKLKVNPQIKAEMFEKK